MGLVYNPGEAQAVISRMQKNLDDSQAKVDNLNRATKQAVDTLQGPQLSGRGYSAAETVLTELVRPSISKASSALERVRSDLDRFKAAVDKAGGEVLDEDKLKQLLEKLKKQRASMMVQIDSYTRLITAHLGDEDTDLVEMYSDQRQELIDYLPTVEADIKKVEKKLERLYAFCSETGGLFSSSAADFSEIDTCASAIGAVSFDGSGGYTLKFKNNSDLERFKELARNDSLSKSVVKSVLSQKTVSQVVKEVGNSKVVKGIRLGALTDSTTSLSRMARRGSALKSAGDDLLKVGNTLAKSKVLKVAGFAGTVFSAGVDYEDQMEKYHDQGRAIKNTAAHLTIESGASTVGMAIGTAILPGAGTLAGAVIGGGLGFVGEGLYDWVENGQAGKDFAKVGKNISNGVNNLKNEAGKVFAGFGRSLGSVFG
ncbi:T7SS effector LXG polymorphic toxin [Lactovum odontotermitis]